MNNSVYHSKIISTGSYFPKRVLTNAEISKLVDTSDEWILERTGIRKRRIANVKNGESNSDLALKATQYALEKAGLKPSDLDLILFCTVSPDQFIPIVSCTLQRKLGASEVPCMDISAACSGFIYGLSVADAYIRAGIYQKVLVIGSEVLSQLTDWEDRGTCILFGDGSGAAIVGRADAGEKSQILSTHIHADGTFNELFWMEAGGSSYRIDEQALKDKKQFMRMKGKEIFKEAVRTLVSCAEEALKYNGLSKDDVDWFIPHQANQRIIDAVAKRLDFPMNKVIVNIQDYGNTSAATVPTAFDQAIADGRIKRGDLVLMDVFGAGFTYGSALLYY